MVNVMHDERCWHFQPLPLCWTSSAKISFNSVLRSELPCVFMEDASQKERETSALLHKMAGHQKWDRMVTLEMQVIATTFFQYERPFFPCEVYNEKGNVALQTNRSKTKEFFLILRFFLFSDFDFSFIFTVFGQIVSVDHLLRPNSSNPQADQYSQRALGTSIFSNSQLLSFNSLLGFFCFFTVKTVSIWLFWQLVANTGANDRDFQTRIYQMVNGLLLMAEKQSDYLKFDAFEARNNVFQALWFDQHQTFNSI